MRIGLVFLALVMLFTSCGEDPAPKPKGYLALEFPAAEYSPVSFDCPYKFEKNELAKVVEARGRNDCWINLQYESLKGTIFITYQPVKNNLDSLLRDAQKLPLQHTIKADVIEGDLYLNPQHNTYGMFYEVAGDAASQAQFYLTDSVNHFLTGSLYFRAQPNFDSILPSAAYLRSDMRHLMETLRWTEE